jgi:hypothetical protein
MNQRHAPPSSHLCPALQLSARPAILRQDLLSGILRRKVARSEAPRIHVWKATDAPDEALRRSIADSLAGLAAESQLTIEKD